MKKQVAEIKTAKFFANALNFGAPKTKSFRGIKANNSCKTSKKFNLTIKWGLS